MSRFLTKLSTDGTPQSSGDSTEMISGSVSILSLLLPFAAAAVAEAVTTLKARISANTVARMFFLFFITSAPLNLFADFLSATQA